MSNVTRIDTSFQVAALEKRVRQLEAENEVLRRLLSRHGLPSNDEIRKSAIAV